MLKFNVNITTAKIKIAPTFLKIETLLKKFIISPQKVPEYTPAHQP